MTTEDFQRAYITSDPLFRLVCKPGWIGNLAARFVGWMLAQRIKRLNGDKLA